MTMDIIQTPRTMPHHTRTELEALYESPEASLGIVRPCQTIDLKVEAVEGDWKPQWLSTLTNSACLMVR
jgi:hypothetical protein